MFSSNRNLLVIINNGSLDEQTIRQEAEILNQILFTTVTTDHFCQVHELVNRNRITSRKNILLRETRYPQLRPFRFLVNLN